MESEIKIIIKAIFGDLDLDVESYKINNRPTWVSDVKYTHNILSQLKNLYDNISTELQTLKYDTIDIVHTEDPLFGFMIHHGDNNFTVEAWSNICNNYMWDERIEWIE